MKYPTPNITIIIAVLNGAATLERCLKSVLSQREVREELIVMDGGSTDGSLKIIEDFREKMAHFESGPDRGIYHAWNKGLSLARGEWVCFLGSDDFFWEATVLSRLTPHLALAKSRGVRVVYGRVVRLGPTNEMKAVLGRPWERIGWQMKHGMPKHLPHPGLMHHRSLFQVHGMFDERFKIAGDYELLLRELKDNPAHYAEDVITVGSSSGGIGEASGILPHMEVYRARKKHGMHRPSCLQMIVFMKALLKSMLTGAVFSPILTRPRNR